MIPSRSSALVVAIALVLAPLGAVAEPRPFDPDEAERAVALAEHFYRGGEYYRAIGELEELALFAPSPAHAWWARLRIAMAYQRGEQHEAAVAAYDRLLTAPGLTEDVAGLARVQRALAHAEALLARPGRGGVADAVSELEPMTIGAGPSAFYASYHQARLAAVLDDRPVERAAVERAAAACGDAGTCASVTRLRTALAAAPPRRRSAGLATALSMVVPGAGSIYAHHYVDGLYYGGLTSLSALGAYDVYDGGRGLGGQKPTFWVLSSLAGLFYLSGLVNAYTATNRRNAVERYRWEQRVWADSAIGMPLDGVQPPR